MERLNILIATASLTALPLYAAPEDATRERHCIETSARYNQIPAQPLWAIRLQEDGIVGGWHINSDHSVGYGLIQINSCWLPLPAPLGHSASAPTYDPRAAGAWILARALARYGAWNRSAVDGKLYWCAVGDYPSHTPSLNRACAVQVWNRYRQQLATRDLS